VRRTRRRGNRRRCFVTKRDTEGRSSYRRAVGGAALGGDLEGSTRADWRLVHGAGNFTASGPRASAGDRVEKPLRTSPKSRSLTGFFMGFRGPKAHSNRPGGLSHIASTVEKPPRRINELQRVSGELGRCWQLSAAKRSSKPTI
jgi:hypothetical protein